MRTAASIIIRLNITAAQIVEIVTLIANVVLTSHIKESSSKDIRSI